MILEPDRLAAVDAHNASGKAPLCRRCGHMLVVHGAGKCGVPAWGCECPSDEFAWGIDPKPAGSGTDS